MLPGGKSFAALILLGVGAWAMPGEAAETVDLKFASFPAGMNPGQLGIAFTQVVQKDTPYRLQVTTGKSGPQMMIEGLKHEWDIFFGTPEAAAAMRTRDLMFEKVVDAPELAKQNRAILSMSLGIYHWTVFESSGIKRFEDIKGKKVFLGAPASAALALTTDVIRAVTGYEPDKDYTRLRFDWASMGSAFADRQVVMASLPTNAPSPMVQQWAASERVRFLGIPKEKLEHPLIADFLKRPGRTVEVMPVGAYGDRQANTEPVYVLGSWVMLTTTPKLSEEAVYKMTKAFWENLDVIHATAAWMKAINKETAFREINIPLHAGAYRYYKEAGFNPPDSLRPPEVN